MKVVFSGAGITEMRGKAQGIIIQKSYGGFQMRVLKQPFKRRSNATQNARNRFGFVNSSWRSLNNTERQTWIDAAPPGISGFEFFSSYNIKNISAGGTIISSYVSPVANPNTMQYSSLDWALNTGVTPNEQTFNRVSGNNSNPTGDWLPSFLWTGWIAASQSFFPRMDRSLIVFSGGYDSSGYSVIWNGNGDQNPVPAALGWKCKFQERWINSVTGQTYTGDMFEVDYGEVMSVGHSFVTGPVLQTAVLTGTTGAYTLVTTWAPSGVNFDSVNWEPKFFMNSWGTSGDAASQPFINVLPATAVNISSPTLMTITFSSSSGDATPPVNSGDYLGIGFNWQNVTTLEKSRDEYSFIQAVNYP